MPFLYKMTQTLIISCICTLMGAVVQQRNIAELRNRFFPFVTILAE